MARSSRRGGCLKITAFSLVLLVALGVIVGTVGERFVRGRIESGVAAAMTQRLGGPTEVSIVDRWVLLGLARNRFETVRGTTASATFTQGSGDSRQTLHVTDLAFTATGVSQLRGSGPFTVEQLSANATLTYAELSRLGGTQITSAGGDRVKVVETASVWGATVAIEVTARPGVGSDGSLTLNDPAATVSGVPVPQALLRPVLKRITDRVELPTVIGLRYDSLTAGSQGVLVTMSGRGVELPR